MRIAIARVLLALAAFLSSEVAFAFDVWTRTNGPGATGVTSLLLDSGQLFAGSAALGVFRSSDAGHHWSAANLGIENERILSLGKAPVGLLAGGEFQNATPGGIYRSTNGGNSWSALALQGQSVFAIASEGSFVYAGVNSGAARSTDGGGTWAPASDGLLGSSAYGLASVNGVVFAATSQGLYRSDDHAASWSAVGGFEFFNFFSMGRDGQRIFAGGFNGVARSTDGGESWEFVELPVSGLSNISAIGFDGATVYAGARGFDSNGVYRSTDDGATWALTTNEISLVAISALQMTSDGLIAGTEERSVIASTDGGLHWSARITGLPAGGGIRMLFSNGNDLYAGTAGSGVWHSNDHGDTWTAINTSDNGQLASELVFGLAAHGTNLFAGTARNGVYRSTDGAATWKRANTGFPLGTFSVFALSAIGANVIAGTTGGIFLSTNGGTSWTRKTDTQFQTRRTASADGFAYALVNTGFGTSTGIYRSTDNGNIWNLVFPSGGLDLESLTADGAFVYVGDLLAGMLRSTDHGVGWNSIDPAPSTGVFSIAAQGTSVFAGCEPDSPRLFRSTNRGSNWTTWNEGLAASASVEALALDNLFLFAGTDRQGVWRRVLPGVTAVDDVQALSIVASPNPARDEVSVRFGAMKSGPATLSLFNAAGARVDAWRTNEATLQLSLARYPLGLYFLEVESGGERNTIKLTHIR